MKPIQGFKAFKRTLRKPLSCSIPPELLRAAGSSIANALSGAEKVWQRNSMVRSSGELSGPFCLKTPCFHVWCPHLKSFLVPDYGLFLQLILTTVVRQAHVSKGRAEVLHLQAGNLMDVQARSLHNARLSMWQLLNEPHPIKRHIAN